MWAPHAPQVDAVSENHNPCLAPADPDTVMREQFEMLISGTCDCDACHLARFKLREILLSKFRE